jgi:hypothetical protein
MKIESKVRMCKHFELVIRLTCTANADLFGNRTDNLTFDRTFRIFYCAHMFLSNTC